MNPVIQARQVTKAFGDEVVVDSVDFSIGEGSIHAWVGPNGAGKSTLLRMMAGLIKPTQGSIHVFGNPVEDGASLRQRVQYISPEVNLYPFFRVKDILKYASLLYERWNPERSSKLMDAFQLPLNKMVGKLSLGLKMRLRVALALSAHADILLMDEATNGMDPAAKDQILDLILQESANRGVTVVLATHQLAEIERVADTVSVIVGGKMVSTNSVDDLKVRVYEVLTSIPEGSEEVIRRFFGVVDYTRTGHEVTFVWNGARGVIKERLQEVSATFVHIRPASLDRWFQSLLKKEGVPSEKIILPDGTPV